MPYLDQQAKEALDHFQQTVGEWADRTFPQSTLLSILAHLSDETRELSGAVTKAARYGPALDLSDPACMQDRNTIALEAADVLLILLHLAHREGFSLWDAVRTKHTINRDRLWGKPDSRGVVRHVEEADDDA